MKNLVILGAGGFAREIYDLAGYCYGNNSDFRVKGFLSDSPTNIEKMGYPSLLGTISGYKPENNDVFFNAIGNVKDRKRTTGIILEKGGEFINLIHSTAVISPSVKFGKGIGIKAYCVIASDVSIGDFTFLQSSVIMGHDVQIGEYCQINSFAFFAGHCKVGNLASINAGARLIQNTVVGDEAVVGMGSVVIRKVKPNTTVFGNPAKKIM